MRPADHGARYAAWLVEQGGAEPLAAARRLGAVVSAFDIRPAAAEQVQSLGAKFEYQDIPADLADPASFDDDLTEVLDDATFVEATADIGEATYTGLEENLQSTFKSLGDLVLRLSRGVQALKEPGDHAS